MMVCVNLNGNGKHMYIQRLNGGYIELAVEGLAHTYLANIDLKETLLAGSEFMGANLSGACLNQAWLRHSDLSNVILLGSDLTHVEAQSCVFRNANLSAANLSGGWFTWSDFTDAILQNATVKDADFYQANFCGADMRCINLESAALGGVTYDEHTLWPDGFDIEEHL